MILNSPRNGVLASGLWMAASCFWLAGCASSSASLSRDTDAYPDLRSSDNLIVIVASQDVAKQHDVAAIPYLFPNLSSKDTGVRLWTIMALIRLSGGLKHGYNFWDEKPQREQAIQRWKKWYRENRSNLLAGRPPTGDVATPNSAPFYYVVCCTTPSAETAQTLRGVLETLELGAEVRVRPVTSGGLSTQYQLLMGPLGSRERAIQVRDKVRLYGYDSLTSTPLGQAYLLEGLREGQSPR
ncbi:MAG: hypothetical protein V3T77_04455 [Planctomycetota bacterium]